MNWSSYVLCWFVATVVLTTLLAGSQASRMTRVNVPYLLGTMVTSNRDRAKLMGVFLHFINGWLLAVFVHLCRRLPGNREIDMVVRHADWVCAWELRVRCGFTCSHCFLHSFLTSATMAYSPV